MVKLAVVQVRGTLGMNYKFKDTLKFLKLVRKNSCSVVENNRTSLGMLVKLKDYVTWGEISPETYKELLEKRGRIAGNKILTEAYIKSKVNMDYAEFVKNFFDGKIKMKDVPGLKKYFRLTPPKGGYEKKGIKKQYSIGGALGYRKEAINILLKKMM